MKAGGGDASLIMVGNGGVKIDVRGGTEGVVTFLTTKATMPVRRRPLLYSETPASSPMKIVPTISLELVLHSLIDDKNW